MAGWLGFTVSDEVYNFLYRGVPITIGANLYLRLLVAPSSRSGGGTETNYSGYSRLTLPRNTTIFSASSNGRITNSGIIQVGTDALSLGNGQLVAFDVVDTPSGAFNKVYNGGPILPAKSIVLNKPVKFRAGALVFTF
jgi:hypothetical protein